MNVFSKIGLLAMMGSFAGLSTAQAAQDNFNYVDERFADIQMLRYKVNGFEQLSLNQKILVYYLSKAAMEGRDILFDQHGKYNLRIRKMLETVYTQYKGDRNSNDFQQMTTYLKRVWFSNGIHHHYACEKFQPEFSEAFFRKALKSVNPADLPLAKGQTVDQLCDEVFPVIFNPSIMKMRVNQANGEDLVLTSAENFYGEGVTQKEAEDFYNAMKKPGDKQPVMIGLNTTLVKENGKLKEKVWKVGGLYGKAIERIVFWLKKAQPYAENAQQKKVIKKLISFYETGSLKTFDAYAIDWLNDVNSMVDFVNGFTEVYGDPLGLKGSWEGFANFKDLEATERTLKLSANAQWFEDNSPVDDAFKKEECKGVSAKVITAAILGGDLYPSSAIGINLPNSDWVRAEHGSKSVTIGNLMDAYFKASLGNGYNEEFVIGETERNLIKDYGETCDNLHTDLHECLGHGSGKLAPGVSGDELKAYGSTIEEARADLFGLYYIADPKLVEMGLTPNLDAYKSAYYQQLLNGAVTQLTRIKPGAQIEEAHMRNRALIANWVLDKGKADKVAELVKKDGKTYLQINDYQKLRNLFGQLLREIQRIKSEGDFEAARNLVETYAVKVDAALHAEVLERFNKLNLAPYKGFINPTYQLVKDDKGQITDVKVAYGESYENQMLRYSKEYSNLPYVNE